MRQNPNALNPKNLRASVMSGFVFWIFHCVVRTDSPCVLQDFVSLPKPKPKPKKDKKKESEVIGLSEKTEKKSKKRFLSSGQNRRGQRDRNEKQRKRRKRQESRAVFAGRKCVMKMEPRESVSS